MESSIKGEHGSRENAISDVHVNYRDSFEHRHEDSFFHAAPLSWSFRGQSEASGHSTRRLD